jgi:hypothetical protein
MFLRSDFLCAGCDNRYDFPYVVLASYKDFV